MPRSKQRRGPRPQSPESRVAAGKARRQKHVQRVRENQDKDEHTLRLLNDSERKHWLPSPGFARLQRILLDQIRNAKNSCLQSYSPSCLQPGTLMSSEGDFKIVGDTILIALKNSEREYLCGESVTETLKTGVPRAGVPLARTFVHKFTKLSEASPKVCPCCQFWLDVDAAWEKWERYNPGKHISHAEKRHILELSISARADTSFRYRRCTDFITSWLEHVFENEKDTLCGFHKNDWFDQDGRPTIETTNLDSASVVPLAIMPQPNSDVVTYEKPSKSPPFLPLRPRDDKNNLTYMCNRCFRHIFTWPGFEKHACDVTITRDNIFCCNNESDSFGQVIYREPREDCDIVVFRVYSTSNKPWAQRIFQFLKTKIPDKCLSYNVDGFIIYAMYSIAKATEPSFLGAFSRGDDLSNRSSRSAISLNCIALADVALGNAYGMLLSSIATQLLCNAGKTGSPLRPIRVA